MPRIWKTCGVSLLELVIALAISAVLVVIAVPSFLNFNREHNLAGVGENLTYALKYARSEAIKRNTTIYVSFVTGDTWCYGMNTGSACNCTTASNCNLGTVTASKPLYITLSTTGLPNNRIQFSGTQGAANVGGGSITFTLYGLTTAMTISIGRLGNTQICTTNLSGYLAC